MSQTVIGFFDDQSQAQRAIEQLQSRGISRDRIDIARGNTGTSGSSSSTAGSPGVNPVSGSTRDENSVRRTSDDRTVDREGRNTNKFTDFFNNLFGGSDNDDADRYSHVAERAGAVVTIHAQSRDEAEAAAGILDNCGALDVDEQASRSGYTNTRGAADMSGRSNVSGPATTNDTAGAGSARWRSRIFDRRLDEHVRLRGSDTDDLGNRNEGI